MAPCFVKHLFLTWQWNLFAHHIDKIINHICSAMNDLPVIGFHAMHKELWDRQGANIASHQKELGGEKLFPRPRKGILERDQHFFAIVLSQVDLGNVKMRKM